MPREFTRSLVATGTVHRDSHRRGVETNRVTMGHPGDEGIGRRRAALDYPTPHGENHWSHRADTRRSSLLASPRGARIRESGRAERPLAEAAPWDRSLK